MIRFETLEIMSADMGEYNPLADIYNVEYVHESNKFKASKNLTDEEARYIGKGGVNTILPYTVQNNYNRDRKPRKFKAAVLENEFLKAVFLPELGGRLWSLFDKEAKKDLLSTNTVFQPANLAIRNAWFSGGVEFNVGLRGHTPLTCSPMFSRIAVTESGEEVLQIYEYERIRGVVYGINAYLPEGSRMIYLHNTIENKQDKEIFMYWWSNIAVPETKETRVIVPADECFTNSYKSGELAVDKIPVPYYEGEDKTYPSRIFHSQDYFYRIRDNYDHFITVMDKDAVGLVHVSTNELKSRKMFLWGQGTGGHSWQSFLSAGTREYIEIQAGLANTQMEHIPMPSNTTWEWTEGYAALKCDKGKAFSEDWNTAVDEAAQELKKLFGGVCAQKYLKSVVPNNFVSYRPLTKGSGFAELEQLSRGEPITSIYSFDEGDITAEQSAWIQLLRQGYMPRPGVNSAPESYVTGAKWQERLEKSLKTNVGNHWYTYYQLGVTAFANGDSKTAADAFWHSIACEPNAWSYRNLAMLKWHEENEMESACELILKAISFKCECVNMYQDCAECLFAAGKYSKWIDIYNSLDNNLKSHPRLQMILARCWLALENFDNAAKIINSDFVMPDVREGEVALSSIWQELYFAILKKQNPDMSDDDIIKLRDKKYPIPAELDFRQNSEQ